MLDLGQRPGTICFAQQSPPVGSIMSGEAKLALHQHGKGKVRVARKWVEDNKHYLVEWSVNTMLESDMSHSFLHGSNEGMTATDTQKNTVSPLAPKPADIGFPQAE